MVWAGDDLGPMELANQDDDKEVFGGGGAASDMEEKRRLLAEMGGSLPRSPSGREVKIKITKKELEELLARVDMQGVTLEHVLAQLMINGTDNDRSADMQRQRSWRPALKSIPEVNWSSSCLLDERCGYIFWA